MDPERIHVDLLIIGAGPAGLAAATAAAQLGKRVIIVEQGRDLDHRLNSSLPDDLASGAGGAGLFSDGKFSFFPSASSLWTVEPRTHLHRAYDWFMELLGSTGMSTPAFPISSDLERSPTPNKDHYSVKKYPSHYMELAARQEIIRGLVSGLRCEISYDNKVTSISVDEGGLLVRGRPMSTSKGRWALRPRGILFGGGRFGPLACELHLPGNSRVFRRLEIGVRLEQPAEIFFLRDNPSTDPKLLLQSFDGLHTWRTFCTCRQGNVVATRLDRWLTVSGRADCPPTGLSNVGFNLRIETESEARKIWFEAQNRLFEEGSVHQEPIEQFSQQVESNDFSSGLSSVFGQNVSRLLMDGVNHMVEQLGRDVLRDTTLHGPCIEGIGYYPVVDKSLKIQHYPIWVAGDSTGMFRGLTAALVSGYFIGERALEWISLGE